MDFPFGASHAGETRPNGRTLAEISSVARRRLTSTRTETGDSFSRASRNDDGISSSSISSRRLRDVPVFSRRLVRLVFVRRGVRDLSFSGQGFPVFSRGDRFFRSGLLVASKTNDRLIIYTVEASSMFSSLQFCVWSIRSISSIRTRLRS